MRTILSWGSMVLATGCLVAETQSLRLTPEAQPQRVFGAEERVVRVSFENPGGGNARADVNYQLLQTTDGLAALLSENRWKTLEVLSGQTVLESARIEFPSVRAETPCAIKWLEGTNRVIGVTHVLAYPTNLLEELRALVGEAGRLGLFDPADQWKPILGGMGVEFEDLEGSGVAGFRGQLAILGPFPSRADMPGDMVRRVEEMAGNGVATVWIQPPPGPRDKLQPSYETIPVGEGTVVVMQHELVADLASSPQSQLNLILCCRLALQPEPPRLPEMNH